MVVFHTDLPDTPLTSGLIMSFIAGVAVTSHSTHAHTQVSMRFQCLAVGHCSVTSSSGFMFIGPVLEKSDDQCLLEMSSLHENQTQRVRL